MISTAQALTPNLTSDDGPLALCPEGHTDKVSRESTHSGQAERSQDPRGHIIIIIIHAYI